MCPGLGSIGLLSTAVQDGAGRGGEGDKQVFETAHGGSYFLPTRSSSSWQTAYVLRGKLATSSKGILGWQHRDCMATACSHEWQLWAQWDMEGAGAWRWPGVIRAPPPPLTSHGMPEVIYLLSLHSLFCKIWEHCLLGRFTEWIDNICKLHITLCVLNKWELSIYSIWILKSALQAVLKETQNISWWKYQNEIILSIL